ncbi:MAG: MFS transporter [Clostridia bacterium]|nr:MFS transporter [Clostridia bacterium]
MFRFWKEMDKSRRSLLLICYFAFFCNGSVALIMGSVMPDLKAAYSLNDTLSGLFISAHSIGNMAAGFLSGLVPLYLGERRSIILLSGLAFLGLLMMLFFGDPVWLFIAFVLTGFGRGSVTSFNNRTVNRITDGSPAASNLLHGAFAIGAILTPVVFLFLSNAISWQAGVLAVVVCGSISLINFSRMKLEKEYPDRKDKTNSTLRFLKNPSFLILAGMMFCYLCSEYSINGWLVTYIQNKRELVSAFGLDGEELTAAIRSYSQTMATLLWAIMLVGRLGCAWLSSRIHQKKLMLASSVGIAAFFIMMLNASSIPAVTLSVAGLGLCMAGVCPMIYSDAAIFTNAYPMATSCLLGIGSVGAILMPVIVGSLADSLGFGGGMSAILVTVILLFVFALLNTVIRTRQPD